MNGIWGTIATGLFATTSAPGNDTLTGLFYGGGFTLLGKQLLGMFSVIAWTVVTITITFMIIKATVGLRVSEEEEIEGLDSCEHGLASAYAGFSLMDVSGSMIMEENENTQLGVSEYEAASEVQKNAAVKVVRQPAMDTGMYKVVILAKLSRYDKLRKAMNAVGVTGMTVTQVMGCGIQKGSGERYRGAEVDATLLPKVKVEVVIGNLPVDTVVEAREAPIHRSYRRWQDIRIQCKSRIIKDPCRREDLETRQDNRIEYSYIFSNCIL